MCGGRTRRIGRNSVFFAEGAWLERRKPDDLVRIGKGTVTCELISLVFESFVRLRPTVMKYLIEIVLS